MKATFFFKSKDYVVTEKVYMLLLLSAIEQARLKKAGGFDKLLNISNTAPLVEKFFLKGKIGFGDGTAIYVFRSLLKDLDFVYKGLEKKFDCKCKIKNTNNEPTFAELLAKQHDTLDSDELNLFTDRKRNLRDRERGKLYATFRAPRGGTLESFAKAYEQCKSRLIKEFQSEKVVVIRGYKSDINLLRSLLNCRINIQELEPYHTLLLYSNM